MTHFSADFPPFSSLVDNPYYLRWFDGMCVYVVSLRYVGHGHGEWNSVWLYHRCIFHTNNVCTQQQQHCNTSSARSRHTSELSHRIENLEANFKCISYSLRWVTISCIVESCICFQYLKKSINKSFKAFEKLISLDLYETYQCKNSLYPNRAGHINMYRGQSCTRCTGVAPIYIHLHFHIIC